MRILLVEDETIIRFYLKSRLQEINGEVIDVNSSEEAIDLLEKDQNFDMVITDINMGHIDGWGLIDYIISHNLKMKIIVESAYLAGDINMQKYSSKVSAFLPKPIDLNILDGLVGGCK